MAWIKSHTVLLRHRKNIELAADLRLKPVHSMGHLHALWHEALEQQEDGDLSKWSDSFLASSAAFSGDAPQFVRLLQKHGWLEENKLLHDWLDHAGEFLRVKYKTRNRDRLVAIWARHGRVYGEEPTKEGKELDRPREGPGKGLDVPDKTDRKKERPNGSARGASPTANGTPRRCLRCRADGRWETVIGLDGKTPMCATCRTEEEVLAEAGKTA